MIDECSLEWDESTACGWIHYKKNMRRILCIIIALYGFYVNPALAQYSQCDSVDFCSLVNMVETNYSGFPTKVNKQTQPYYDQLKQKLYNSVCKENRPGYEAAAEYVAWFEDYHLSVGGSISEAYMKPRVKYDSIKYAPRFISLPVDENTYLIRIPSFAFEDSIVSFVENAVNEYKESGKENLIIDIRGNGGGLDYTFTPLVKLIYNRPFKLDGAEFRATSDIARFLRGAYESQNGQPSWALAVADSIDTDRYEFVPIPGVRETISLDTINIFPRRVAVIIDNNNASSAEQFILFAKLCSDRVAIYGKDNTLGAYDYSNLMSYDLPCSKKTCKIPTSRTIGISEDNPGIDLIGIAPDVTIPLPYPSEITDNIDLWIRWIAEDLVSRL